VLSGGERGLLGLTFHPQFFTNGLFYVNYTRRPDGATVVAEYRNGAERRILFIVPQPFENHNGGMTEFGPDGLLYVGMGDGGSGNDPQNHAQNPNDLLGKMLRINVDVPNSRPEIYAVGLRNPWRFSFDRLTGQLYAGDVGQSAREEVDIIVQGGNYGWRVWEGNLCTGLGPAPCSTPGFIPPIVEYNNTGGNGRCSVTGGYVYRGVQASLPYGAYVFGDFCSGEIFMLKDGVQSVLLDTTLQISSFGEDEGGEIYVVSLTGSIFRLTNPDAVGGTQRTYATGDMTPFVVSTAGSSPTLRVGYGRIQVDAGQLAPAGLAIFGYQQRGVLVSEASVPAVRATSAGRLIAEVGSNVNTGVALANPNDEAAAISFYFTDSSGTNFRNGTLVIPPKQQIAAFLNEAPFDAGSSVFGTFSFTSSVPIAVLALRGIINERADFLITTLPVVDLDSSTPSGTIISHFASGGGWTTQVILINPSDLPISGNAQFLNRSGQLIQATPYSVQPRSSARILTTSPTSDIQTGSVRLSTPTPAVSIFSFQSNGITVSQAGVPTIPLGTAFRAYVETGTTIRSGIAVANPTTAAVDVALELSGLTAILPIPANGQAVMFLDEIPAFSSLPPFQGVLRMTSTTPIAVTGLRGRTNERGEFLTTTTTPVDETALTGSTEMFFPHFAEGGGYSMQFVLYGRATSGTTYFFDQAGNPAFLIFR
jgi:glucose/arabinose dehydrogenase